MTSREMINAWRFRWAYEDEERREVGWSQLAAQIDTDKQAAIAQAVAAERERCRRIVEWHFGRDTMKSLECTSEIENAIRARTTS